MHGASAAPPQKEAIAERRRANEPKKRTQDKRRRRARGPILTRGRLLSSALPPSSFCPAPRRPSHNRPSNFLPRRGRRCARATQNTKLTVEARFSLVFLSRVCRLSRFRARARRTINARRRETTERHDVAFSATREFLRVREVRWLFLFKRRAPLSGVSRRRSSMYLLRKTGKRAWPMNEWSKRGDEILKERTSIHFLIVVVFSLSSSFFVFLLVNYRAFTLSAFPSSIRGNTYYCFSTSLHVN